MWQGSLATMYERINEVAETLPFDRAPAFRITPREIRRTYACLHCIASAMNEPGALDIRSLQDAMGHDSLETTALYLADFENYLRRKLPRAAVDDLLDAIIED
jgi:integrase